MDEVDKRIAEKVMGEPEPNRNELSKVPSVSAQGNWRASRERIRFSNLVFPLWEPLPFSSDIDQAMRAVDKYLDQGERSEDLVLRLTYDKHLIDHRWSAHFEKMETESPHRDMFGDGDSHTEAICNLLLALADSKRLKILDEITKESQELGLYDDD